MAPPGAARDRARAPRARRGRGWRAPGRAADRRALDRPTPRAGRAASRNEGSLRRAWPGEVISSRKLAAHAAELELLHQDVDAVIAAVEAQLDEARAGGVAAHPPRRRVGQHVADQRAVVVGGVEDPVVLGRKPDAAPRRRRGSPRHRTSSGSAATSGRACGSSPGRRSRARAAAPAPRRGRSGGRRRRSRWRAPR